MNAARKYFLPAWHPAEDRPKRTGRYLVLTGLANLRLADFDGALWHPIGSPEISGGGDVRSMTVIKFWSEFPHVAD